METIVLGSTKEGYVMPLEEAVSFSSHAAGVCYMKDDIQAIIQEDIEKTSRRAKQTLGSGHHSVYEHPTYTLVFQGIPKIIAMILNNEKKYTTSEKSARYTFMKPDGQEAELYKKWTDIFKQRITDKYPKMEAKAVEKYAIENARYMISVFTPTTMVYTTDLKQLNYLLEMFQDFVDDVSYQMTGKIPATLFYEKVKMEVIAFIKMLAPFHVPGMQRPKKKQVLSIFNAMDEPYEEYFGDVYCTQYMGSFAQYAQAHRHRTLSYNFFIDEKNPTYYVPAIVGEWEEDWLNDLNSLPAGSFPQATQVKITERGDYEKFILKCFERICCHAQREIAMQTADTFRKYFDQSSPTSRIRRDHPKFTCGDDLKSKPQIPYLLCAGSCNMFGRRYALNREV